MTEITCQQIKDRTLKTTTHIFTKIGDKLHMFHQTDFLKIFYVSIAFLPSYKTLTDIKMLFEIFISPLKR